MCAFVFVFISLGHKCVHMAYVEPANKSDVIVFSGLAVS